ncbi:MAG: hypothetical protein EAX90_01275 [Candidatus Heimdallarchaeota archaeon]|nr:hypothetical protein [Candidatus Heimdallarchaeota archaeon]
MPEEKLIAKGPFLDYFKDKTSGLKIANETKDQIIEYFEAKLELELDRVCSWALEIAKLQGKRTLQDKDWEFIVRRMNSKE